MMRISPNSSNISLEESVDRYSIAWTRLCDPGAIPTVGDDLITLETCQALGAPGILDITLTLRFRQV